MAGARVAVVGAGAWGTALAGLLANRGHQVLLWSFEEHVARSIEEDGRNPYLPDVDLPANLAVTDVLADAVRRAEVVVSVSPSQFVGQVMAQAAPHIPPEALLVSASKGIELQTLRRMDEVLCGLVPPPVMERFCVLSGPSFATEVAREEPTAVVVASADGGSANRVQAHRSSGSTPMPTWWEWSWRGP
jgi:glycerol-3-phosphate dehydrogenase (NAD(P)+)